MSAYRDVETCGSDPASGMKDIYLQLLRVWLQTALNSQPSLGTTLAEESHQV